MQKGNSPDVLDSTERYGKLDMNFYSFFRSHKQETKIKIWWNCLKHDLFHTVSLWNWKLAQCFKMPLNCRELFSSCTMEWRCWHTKAVSNKLQSLNRLQSETIANLSLFLVRVCSYCKQTFRILYTSLGFVLQEFLSPSATILLK